MTKVEPEKIAASRIMAEIMKSALEQISQQKETNSAQTEDRS
jgi:hypothetical protein